MNILKYEVEAGGKKRTDDFSTTSPIHQVRPKMKNDDNDIEELR